MALALLQHDFGRFDHCRYAVANLQLHFLGASPGDDAFNLILAHLDRHVSHDAVHFELHNLSFDLISCRKFGGQWNLLVSAERIQEHLNSGPSFGFFFLPVKSTEIGYQSTASIRILNARVALPGTRRKRPMLGPAVVRTIFRLRPYQTIYFLVVLSRFDISILIVLNQPSIHASIVK